MGNILKRKIKINEQIYTPTCRNSFQIVQQSAESCLHHRYFAIQLLRRRWLYWRCCWVHGRGRQRTFKICSRLDDRQRLRLHRFTQYRIKKRVYRWVLGSRLWTGLWCNLVRDAQLSHSRDWRGDDRCQLRHRHGHPRQELGAHVGSLPRCGRWGNGNVWWTILRTRRCYK